MRIPVGKYNFDEIRKDHDYYVDKTELLFELAERAGNEITLFTRPRRFGKTLMMSMMESFFSIQKGDSQESFEGLAVMRHEDFCAKWMNQYPVLLVTLKGVEDLSFDGAYKTLEVKLADLCKKNEGLLGSGKADIDDKRVFMSLKAQQASMANVKGALKTIMRMMHAEYGKPVILLIDEYDVPLARASEQDAGDKGYYQKMLNVIRGMFDAALKDNEYLKFAVITGCLRIAKESIFTGTNNLPNEEISNIFEEAVIRFFKDSLDRTKQEELMEALWDGDEDKASERMTDILFDTISYHDYHEDYYHAFLTGIISGLGYAVKSKQENGLGRSDIVVLRGYLQSLEWMIALRTSQKNIKICRM